MHRESEVKAAFDTDWHSDNLAGMRAVLAATYLLAEEKTDPLKDPVFNSPNRNMARGYLRWFLLDSCLAIACQRGLLHGINPYWVNLQDIDGSYRALELRGERSALMVTHLSKREDAIKDSKLRLHRRKQNQSITSPMLLGFETTSLPEDELINLTIVHGDKKAEFAYARMYNDPFNLRSYISLSRNLMLGSGQIASIDEELIEEATIGLKNIVTAEKAAQG